MVFNKFHFFPNFNSTKEQITEGVAKTLLKTGLGLSDDEINSILSDNEPAQPEQMAVDTTSITTYVDTGIDLKKKKKND